MCVFMQMRQGEGKGSGRKGDCKKGDHWGRKYQHNE